MGKPDKNSTLKDFVLKIRQAKTRAEERAVVNTESAYIREALRDLNTSHRNRAIAKLMFIGMLGYPTQFGSVDSLQLLTSSDYAEKRTAYLALSLLQDESNELMMLATCSVKRDLEADSSLVIGLALGAIASIATAEMTRFVLADVIGLLRHKRSFVRRKAALAGCRIVRMVPECAADFLADVEFLVEDQNPSCQNAGTYLVHEITRAAPQLIPELGNLVPVLLKTLDNQAVIKSLSSDYTFHEVNNPFLIVTTLKLLRALSSACPLYRSELEETLSRLTTNLLAVTMASYSIFYEFTLLVLKGDFSPALKFIATSTISTYLRSKEPNYQYTGLRCLQQAVLVNPDNFPQYKHAIIKCLDCNDSTVSIKALEILSQSVTEDNAVELVDQLFIKFKQSEQDYRRQIGAKICDILKNFQSQSEWFINLFIELLEEDPAAVPETLLHTAISVLQKTPQVQMSVVRRLTASLSLTQRNEILLKLAVWSVGEYFPLVESQEAVIETLENLSCTRLADKSLGFLVSALFKIGLMRPDFEGRVRYLLEQQADHTNIELQQRVCEYLALLSPEFPQLRQACGPQQARQVIDDI